MEFLIIILYVLLYYFVIFLKSLMLFASILNVSKKEKRALFIDTINILNIKQALRPKLKIK